MRGNAKARQAQLQAQLGPVCDVSVTPAPRSHVLIYAVACKSCHWWARDTRPAGVVESWRIHEDYERIRLRRNMIAAGMNR